MQKFAEICLLCQKREFFTIFHHLNKNGSSSANFEARALLLFANENLEQVLIFCFSTWCKQSSISARKFISFHGKLKYNQFWGKNGAKKSILKRPKFFRTFHATKCFRHHGHIFLFKVLLSFLWPTSCSKLMCMKLHNFWYNIGSDRAKSPREGVYIPPGVE